MKSKDRSALNFETVGAIVAMIVGVCALYVTWDQGQVMRKQQHASVWPLLSLDINAVQTDETIGFEVTVGNDGVGPAIIKSSDLTWRGESLESISDLLEIFPDELQQRSDLRANFNTSLGVLGAGDQQLVFGLEWPQTDENLAAIQNWFRQLASEDRVVNLEMCYCSVFDRCWTTADQNRIRDNRVRSCPAEGEDFSAKMITTLNELEETSE